MKRDLYIKGKENEKMAEVRKSEDWGNDKREYKTWERFRLKEWDKGAWKEAETDMQAKDREWSLKGFSVFEQYSSVYFDSEEKSEEERKTLWPVPTCRWANETVSVFFWSPL